MDTATPVQESRCEFSIEATLITQEHVVTSTFRYWRILRMLAYSQLLVYSCTPCLHDFEQALQTRGQPRVHVRLCAPVCVCACIQVCT